MSLDLRALLKERRVLVTLGSGGVGKTTLAATLALQAALLGRRTLVLTIDPARRLANALGLEALTTDLQQVELGAAQPEGASATGELWAMMLDAPRALDLLVAKHASSPDARDRILGHRLYPHMVQALSGTKDLAALEQLYDLVAEDRYELIVLDTPPKEHFFDFLDAPARFRRILSPGRLRWLLAPLSGAERKGRLAGLGSRLAVKTLARFTGIEVLQALASLLMAMLDLGDGFAERSARVEQLLRSDKSAFLVVTRPDSFTLAEARDQRARLVEQELPFAGILVNRCHTVPPGAGRFDEDVEGTIADLCAALGSDLSVPPEEFGPLLRKLVRGLELVRSIVEQEQRAVAEFASEGAPCPVLCIPQLDHEVHDIAQLLRFGERLVGGP